MQLKKSIVFVAIIALFGLGNFAYASPITFIHTSSGSGTLAGNPFNFAPFTITGLGDTNNRQPFGGGFFIDHTSASINITGVGILNFITGTRTFNNQNVQVPGFSRAGIGGADLLNGPQNAVFAGWDMLSSIGPIAGNLSLLQWGFSPVVTDQGVLVFNNGSTQGSFEARVQDVDVPEPGTLLLLGAGLMGLGVFRRVTG